MSDTPRTDAVINATCFERGVYEELDRMTLLARELERENARLREALSIIAHSQAHIAEPNDWRTECDMIQQVAKDALSPCPAP